MIYDKTSPLTIEEYNGNETEWNEFVLSHPEGRFCHLWQYSKVINETYGYCPYRFVIRVGGKIAAVLPTVLARSILFGKKLVSQPFSEYGGILAKEIEGPGFEEFLNYTKEFCARRHIGSVELHGNLGVPEKFRKAHFIHSNPYGYAVLNLDIDLAPMRLKLFDHQIRKALNKAERSGVKSFEDSSHDLIRKKFWPLYLLSMKRLGSPPHSLDYFMKLKTYFPMELKIFWAEVQGEVVSALMGFAVGKRVQITNIASDDKHWDLRPNDLVHWEFIKWSCQNGYSLFDFGSVRYEGQLRYKKKWGAEIKECGYYYICPENKRIKSFSSSSKMMTTFGRLWGSCVPISLTSMLGPTIRKQLVR